MYNDIMMKEMVGMNEVRQNIGSEHNMRIVRITLNEI